MVVDTYSKQPIEVDTEGLENAVRKHFSGDVCSVHQKLVHHHLGKYWMSLKVAAIYKKSQGEHKESESKGTRKNIGEKVKFGVMDKSTVIALMGAPNPFLRLKQQTGQGMCEIPLIMFAA